MSMTQVLQQILIIFCYVIIGFGAGKFGIIDPEQRLFLTKLCSSLLLPFTILSAANMSAGAEEFRNLGLALVVLFFVFGGTMVISLLLCKIFHADQKLRVVITGLVTFPNCMFLGLPLCAALFGEIAVLYSSAAMIAFNVLFFTVQLPLFTGGKFNWNAIFNVPTMATAALLVMLSAGIHWPVPLQTVISSIGSMITPMSLIIIGVMLSENDLLAIFREKQIYLVGLVRNFLIPIISIFLLTLVPVDAAARLCILVLIACPCATLTTIYSIQTNTKPELCARAVLFSTILFAVSLPVVIALAQCFPAFR